MEIKSIETSNVLKKTAYNSRYKIFGYLAEFKDGFVLGKFVHNGKNSHL
ncbi:hypothetical protein CLU82_0266 [Flavobacterium sp. 5]|nr:hypothetical protein CLU82_0266 [Flavobacterium sp. 5]